MKIYPRIVEIKKGTEECEFKIQNTSKEDRVLLFKIRRSEPKLIEYHPKVGIVEPGVTKTITMQLVNANVTFARLLVKLVSIKRDQLQTSFSESWDLGAADNVVKKVVDVKNGAYRRNLRDDDTLSESMASEDFGELRSPGVLSPTDSITSQQSGPNTQHTHEETVQRLTRTMDNISSPMSAMSPSQEEAFEISAGTPPSHTKDTSDEAFKPISSESKPKTGDEKATINCEKDDLALACSSIKPLGNSKDSVVVCVNGSDPRVVDSVVNAALRARCIEAFTSKKMVCAVEVTEAASVKSFAKSFGRLFDEEKNEIESIRSVALETNLKHLIFNGSAIKSLDASINRFTKLNSVDVSGNELTSISGELALSQLRRLDISNNKLTSLRALECLTSLRTLNASRNEIKSLNALNILVPLGRSLTNADFSLNPISKDSRYAAYVISAFPRLQIFDGLDLQLMDVRTSGRQRAVSGSYSAGTPSRAGNRGVYTPQSAPALPTENNLAASAGTGEGYGESKEDKDFRRRLKHAIKTERTRFSPAVSDVDQTSSIDTASVSGDEFVDEEEELPKPPTKRPIAGNRVPFSSPSAAKPPTPPALPSSSSSTGKSNGDEKSKLTKPVPFSDHLIANTTANRGRRMSQKGIIISHWSGHSKDAAGKKTPVQKESRMDSLTQSTSAARNRRKSFGMNESAELLQASFDASATGVKTEDSGYMSDPTGMPKNSFRGTQNPDAIKFKQMQEDPRYSIYHPRYRVPTKTFGFSKPFAHRKAKSDKTTADVPLFDKYVTRMRDGFEKMPQRGTFSRASKGLQAEWYPMDYADLEAVRRQGYFHETIGDIQKYSYRDTLHGGDQAQEVHHGEGIYSGSVAVSPRNKNRRASIMQHESRQYKFEKGRTAAQDEDAFSDHKKWYPSAFNETASSTASSTRDIPSVNIDDQGRKNIPTMSLNISLDSHASSNGGALQHHHHHQQQQSQQQDSDSQKLEAYLKWLESQNTRGDDSASMGSMQGEGPTEPQTTNMSLFGKI